MWVLIMSAAAFGGISLGKFNKAKKLPLSIPLDTASPEVLAEDITNVQEDFTTLKEAIKTTKGTYGIYIEDLRTGEVFEYNATQKFYGASLFKLILASSVLKKVDTKDIIEDYYYVYKEHHYEKGSGSIASYPIGSKFTVYELLGFLLKESDNIAQNILTELVGEGALVQSSKEILKEDTAFVHTNTTNASEVGTFIKNLYMGRYLRPSSRTKLFDLMSNTLFEDRVAGGLDDRLLFAHKIGNWPYGGSWHDCGLVLGEQPVVVCIMSKNTTYDKFLEISHKVGNFATALVYSQR